MLGYDVDAWDAVYRTNIQAAWFVTGAFLPLLVKAREAKAPAQGGRIINIASISGVTKETQSGQQIYNVGQTSILDRAGLIPSILHRLPRLRSLR